MESSKALHRPGGTGLPKMEQIMAKYLVSANSTEFGIYEAQDAQTARDLCAQDAGYESEKDMESRLNTASELVAELVAE